MAKLQLDLTGVSTEEERSEAKSQKPETAEVRPTSKSKKSVTGEEKKLREMAEGLPSPGKAKIGALKRAPRTQFSFTNFPQPIKDAFAHEAKKRNMGLKEYLFFCLRAGGMDIPPYEEIDGRRR